MQIQIHTHREIPFLQKKEVAWALKKVFLGGIRASTYCNGRGKLRELYDIGRSVQFVNDCILLKVGCRFDPQYRDSSAP